MKLLCFYISFIYFSAFKNGNEEFSGGGVWCDKFIAQVF